MRARYTDWAICAVSLAVFVFLTAQIVIKADWLFQFDENVAHRAKQNSADHLDLLEFARNATKAGGTTVMPILAIAGSALLFATRKPKLAAFWLAAALLGQALNEGTKRLVDRPRPDATLRDSSVHEQSFSYPSGHAMGSIIGYGAMTYIGWTLLRRYWMKLLLATSLGILVLIIGWTRIYLRAHWCTDVLGGWALGLSWLLLCITFVVAKKKKS
jgi:undecaprenyl-diphosphatase